MIPQDNSAAVTHALQQAFGKSEPEHMQQLPSGLSSDLFFRITIAAEPFLLVVMPHINEINDPMRRFICMKMASEAGVAPEVRYLDFDGGISITSFIEARPLSVEDARIQVPRLLAHLHALPPFPKEFNYVTAAKSIQRFRNANLLKQSHLTAVFEPYSRLAAIYPRFDCDMVSCHMDLKPETILFDGHRIWLSDWKAAFLNDRYFDLAVAANYLVADQDQEGNYLNEYFGRAASSYEFARFFLMRQIVNSLAASLYLLIGSQGKPIDLTQFPADFEQTHRSLWEGTTDLQDNSAKVSYGLTHWYQLEKNLRSSRFEESLETLSERHAGVPFSTLLPVL